MDQQDNSGTPVELLEASRAQAGRIGASLREKALSSADSKKGTLVSGLDELAEKLDGSGSDELTGQLAHVAVDAARKAARVLESSSTEELLERGAIEIRARPALFIAGCLGLGFLGARLLRK